MPVRKYREREQKPVYEWRACLRWTGGLPVDLDFLAHLEKIIGDESFIVCGAGKTHGERLWAADRITFRREPVKRCEKCLKYATLEEIKA